MRTPYEDNTIGVVEGCFEGSPCEPDYEDIPPNGPSGTGLRPVLKIKDGKLSDDITIEPGDIISIAGMCFTALSKTLLLSERLIGDPDDGYGIFDEETNVYKDSSAKEQVDEWFQEEIEPFL